MKMNRPQLTVLSLAISAALTSVVPMVTQAQTVISQNETVSQQWVSGDFTVNAGVSLSMANPTSNAVLTGGLTLGTMSNNGTISSRTGAIILGSIEIAMLNNSGTIHGGSFYAITNNPTEIQVLNNSGTVSGDFGGIYNNNVIDALINSGVISSSAGTGIVNDVAGNIGTIGNSGQVDSISNAGTIGSFANDSSFNNDGGTITSLTNTATGTIFNIVNQGQIRTLNNSGTIDGFVALSNGTTNPVIGAGVIGMLNNTGTIIGRNGSGISNTNGTIGALTNSGYIGSKLANGIFNNTGAQITALSNAAGGTIEGQVFGSGVFNGGVIDNLKNDGTIHGTIGISNGDGIGMGSSYTGTIGTLLNSGTINGSDNAFLAVGILNGLGSRIETFNSDGVIKGDVGGIFNLGNIDLLTNAAGGLITGPIAIANVGTITSLVNDGSISSAGMASVNFNAGIINAGLISSLNNTGMVDGQVGIANLAGTIISLSNSGSIHGENGILNAGSLGGTGPSSSLQSGTIGTLSNSGTITGTGDSNGNAAGIQNRGTIDTLDNSGAIIGAAGSTGNAAGIVNLGTITSLNNSGLITAVVDALYLEAGSTLRSLTNSGTIAGGITNLSGQALIIHGGDGTTFGLLTGVSGGKGIADIGLLTSQSNDVVFASGNQLLNDHIDVGGSHVVTNAGGVLQVNHQINITGNYRQNAAAVLNIGVANSAVANGDMNDAGYGRLVVSGSVVMDAGSGVMLKKVDTYRFANGQRYLVIQANAAGTDFNEAALRYGATGFNGTVTGSTMADGGNLDLLLTLDGGTDNLATESNAHSALNGLFSYTGTDAGLMNLFNAAAAQNSGDEGNRIGAQLSPSSSTAAVTGSSAVVTQNINNIAFSRLDSTAPSGAQSTTGVSTGEAMRNTAGWGQAFGGRASDDGRNGVSGYHASYTGLLIGADTTLNDHWRAGGLVSYATTSISNDGNNAGSSAHVDAYGLTAYAGYTGDAWYLNTTVGVTRSDIDARRVLGFTGFNGIANSSYNGTQYVASMRAGYPLRLDDTIVTPQAGLVYSRLSLDGYTETGGNGAALHVEGSQTHSLKSDLGVKVERSYQRSFGWLKPTAQLLWRHEYSNTRLQSVANFAADASGATSFVTEGPQPVQNTGVLSLGLTLMRHNNLTLSVNYTLEQGGGYTSQTGDLLARWQF